MILGFGAVLRAGAFVFEPRIDLDYDHNEQDSYKTMTAPCPWTAASATP
jgi:hypothetical protein